MKGDKNWAVAVLEAVKLDPWVCPMCGLRQQAYGWRDGTFRCDCFDSPTGRALVILTLTREVKASILSLENPGPILRIADRDGDVVADFIAGSDVGPSWQFYEGPQSSLGIADYPIPEGLRLRWLSWWPHEELKEYDHREAQQVQDEIKRIVLQLKEKDWLEKLCPICGSHNCDGAEVCSDTCFHLARYLANLKEAFVYFRYLERKQERRERQTEAQSRPGPQSPEDFERILRRDGFFNGRMGKVVVPPCAEVIFSEAKGEYYNPVQLIILVDHGLTLTQLQSAVESEGDSSTLEEAGGNLFLSTPYVSKWVGKEGVVVKALSKALGRFIRVTKKS